MPQDPREIVRFVRELTRASLNDWQRYQLTFGRTGFGNPPRAGLAEPVFVAEQIARPAATMDFRAWVSGIKVTGVRGGANPGIIFEQKLHLAGDVVDEARGITLLEYDHATRVAVFEDATKAVAGRKF